MIYALIFLVAAISQGASVLFASVLSLNDVYLNMVAQLLNVALTVIIYKKVRLYKFFNYVNQRIVFKTTLVTALSLFWIMVAWFRANPEIKYEAIIFQSIIFIIIFGGIYELSKRSDERIRKMPKEIHDTKKTLRAMYTEIVSLENEHHPIKHMMQVIEVKYPDAVINDLEAGDMKGNIIKFIENQINNRVVLLNAGINYVEPNPRISLSFSLEIRGTLLENAIETTLKS